MTATERSKVKKVVECTRSHDINVTTATTGVARGLGAVSHSKTYKFDKVFDSRSTQLDVYNAVVSSQLNDVLNGYNCTILAYGQTGTGKTYTMEGERSNDVNYSWDTDPKAGIIPRALSQLFDMLEQMGCEFSVRVSLLEIYNEEIYDLLSSSPEETKLKLYDDQSRKGSVVVAGLQEVRLQNKSAVYDILQDGAMKRKTAATKLNEFSSRSHSVFSVTVHTKDITQNGMEEEELVKIGKLNLVDLAGSENIGRSGAIDKRAREAGNINMSLLTLGRCITALVEHSPHVPYRESKLTRLLQDSLGGATKTSIIATISPGSDNLEETLSTLDYACRAKNIHNRPKVNQKLTKTALIKEYNDEIEKLRREVQAARDKNGVYLQPKQYDEMVLKIEDLTATLQQRSEELTELELLYGQNSQQLVDARRKVADLQEELSVVSQALDEQRYVKEELADYSSQHYRQSLKLVEAAKTVESDVQQLHEKVGRVQQTNDANLRTAGSFSGSLKAQINEMCGEAMGAFQQSEVHVRRVMDGVEQVMSMQDEDFSDLSSIIKGISRDLSEQLQESETAAASLVTEHTAQVEKQREIARHIHAAAEDNASKLKATLVGVRQAMSSLLPIVENLKARNEAQQVEIQQQRKAIQEFENNVADHLDSIRCNVDALANEQEANMNAIEARVTSFASELFASTRAMKEKTASQREAERNIDAVARFADHVTGHMQRHLVAEEEHAVAAVRSVEKHVTRCVADVTSAADRGEDQQTTFSATVDNSSESLTGELDDGLASLTRQVDHFATIVQRANAAHGNATSAALADMSDKLSERRDEVRREVAPLDDVAGAARSRHDAMHDALVETLVGIDDFYQDKLARVVPTGQTPAKQEYKYKRAITPPPEESRLVERFRSSRSNDDPPAAGAGDSHDDPAVLDDAFRTSEQEESMDVEQNENVLNESVTIPDCGGIPFFKAGKNGGGINTRKRR